MRTSKQVLRGYFEAVIHRCKNDETLYNSLQTSSVSIVNFEHILHFVLLFLLLNLNR